ncbi:MAG: type II toxin-antitoxin system VapC family toxin [Thermoleophilaceae bacterium]|nr:type II toxin-antitoxin system VapC family toxin [Thermoleophilaceae bacterium]
MADLLVDSDVFIDHLRGARALRPRRHRIHYSAVTRCELFAGPADQEDVVAQLLSPFAEVDVDGVVAERAGRIRRRSGLLTPDALIAATALVHRLGLVTRNRRDFERVRGLRFADLG